MTRFRIPILCLIYVVVALALLPGFRWAINADGLSYIAVARRWLTGDWHMAFNGHWGPLLPWTLVPFLAAKMDPLLAGKIVAILTGLLTIPALEALASRFRLSQRLRTVILLALLPSLWLFTFHKLTPDFLVVGALSWYSATILDPRYADRRFAGILCGLWGALSYYAKSFGFPFFISQFTLATILMGVGIENRDQRRAILRHYLAGMLVFALLTVGWIATLSGKYGRLTVGTAGGYTRALSSPDFRGEPAVTQRGFMAPLNASSPGAWEDPSRLPVLRWSATESPSMMKHQIRILLHHAGELGAFFARYAPLSAFILVALLIRCFRIGRPCMRPGGEALPLLTVALYAGGYALVKVNPRYLFICPVLFAFMGAQLAQHLESAGWLRHWRKPALWLALAVSIAAYPTLQTAIQYRYRGGQDVKVISEVIARLNPTLKGGIAANRHWPKSWFVTHHLGQPYFGVQNDLPDSEVIPTLKRLGARYYLVWDRPGVDAALFSTLPELTAGKIQGLKMYDLAAATPATH
jgi:hypothetical protein